MEYGPVKTKKMNEQITQIPALYDTILKETQSRGFTMPSDLKTGSFLKTLAASKPGGRFLELGTGTGLSTAWILEGMDPDAELISIDNDDAFQDVARQFLGKDRRLTLLSDNGERWIERNLHQRFDFIFADSWPGKYNHFDETIGMLNRGGFYIIDDMCEQPNWPQGHAEKAKALLANMGQMDNVVMTKMIWSTGIVLLVKK